MQGNGGQGLAWPLVPLAALAAARGALFPFVPVCLSLGIGLWFALPWEPGVTFYLPVALACLVLFALGGRGPELAQVPALALACLCLGLLAAGARAHLVAAPVLDFRYYGPIQGRIVDIDRSESDKLRLTLDQVVLERMAPERTPRTVRVSLHWVGVQTRAEAGKTVILTGHLTAPPGPSEPDGFDFRRMAFFSGLGAVGYSRTPVLALAPPEPGALRINRLRAALSQAIMARIPGQAGAFAAGAVTGDRAGITQDTVEALRDSNLAHLLAISGMNMAFLTGFVFALVRYGLALVPPMALRLPGKKVAAVVALAVAGFYLALSGANVATERAFVMVAVMLGAVLVDRRAFSMRTVALAAVVLLLWQPESLLSPGFQMSFAATVVLVAGFNALDRAVLRDRLPRIALPVFTLLLSSVLAGVATAPLGAAHFNRFTDYGLIANLLTVPAMGLLIMPGMVIAALLAPLGLAAPGLWAMELGARWILLVAHQVAGWQGAITGIPAPGPWSLPVMALGALWLILWPGRARWAGIGGIALSLVLWSLANRPPLLISGDGALAGLLGPEGRALSTPTGAGFAADSWLENDGDTADQETAALRPGFVPLANLGGGKARGFHIGGAEAILLRGKRAAEDLAAACALADLVILPVPAPEVPEGCLVIDADLLRQTGTLALWPGRLGEVTLIASNRAGRLWTGQDHPGDPVRRTVLLQRSTVGSARAAQLLP